MKSYLYCSLIILLALSATPNSLSSELKTVEKSTSNLSDAFSKRLNKSDLLALIARGKKTDATCLRLAGELLDTVYETQARYITSKVNGVQYGHVFLINPEIVADLMRFSQNKKVLEIGAARGENALLIGLAGAQEVYINDINPTELHECIKSIRRLPEKMQAKYHVIKGDCQELFEDARYTELFDVIYARNIFHYFIGDQREQFVRLVCRILKPGGRLVLAVNSVFLSDECKMLVKEHPDAYVFKARMPTFRLPGNSNKKLLNGMDVTVESDIEKVDIMKFHWTTLIEFSEAGMIVYSELLHLSRDSQREVLKMASEMLKLNGAKNLELSGISLDCHTCHTVCYTRSTIKKPFVGTNLEMVNALSTDSKGHVTPNQNDESSLTVLFEKQSGRWGLTPPTAHRTVRTGPYTALHVSFIHFRMSYQCLRFSSDRILRSISSINHLFG